MKYSTKQEKIFNPVTLTLTFETEREYKLFTQFIGEITDKEMIDYANRAELENYEPMEPINNFGEEDRIPLLHLFRDMLFLGQKENPQLS